MRRGDVDAGPPGAGVPRVTVVRATVVRVTVARVVVLWLVVLAGVAATGHRAEAGVTSGAVTIYGDSVLVGGADAVTGALRGDAWDPRLTAFEGASLRAVLGWIERDRGDLGEVVILVAGNNYFGDPAGFRRDVDRIMTALAEVPRVVWFNLAETRPDRREPNLELAAAAGRWPTLEVVDWNALVRAHPGATWSDGLHLRPAGARLMASVMVDRLRAYRRGEPPASPPGATVARPVAAVLHGSDGSVLADDRVRSTASFSGAASTPTGAGAWVVSTAGGVFTFGDAPFLGSMGGRALAAPVVGIAATPTGAGYWLVASDGGVFAFGDARFRGSMGGRPLNEPIVALVPTPSGRGYWLVASDGGVFAFGDARFRGSMGGRPLARPVVAAAASPSGRGYWLVGADGGVFAFGDAPFVGSAADPGRFWPVVDVMVAPGCARGLQLATADGGVIGLGSAPHHPDRRGADPRDLFVAAAARPGGGWWLVAQRPA